MNKKEIPEIKKLYLEYRQKRSEERKALQKLKAINNKFSFINALSKERKNEKDDKDLEYAVLELFKSIGFKGTKPKLVADVDVKVKFKDVYFGIEVKNGKNVSENDMFQALKHKNRYEENYHALVVHNNSKTNQNFDQPRIIDAVNNLYTIITTKDLLKGYSKLKNKKITFKQFVSSLQTPGLVTFN